MCELSSASCLKNYDLRSTNIFGILNQVVRFTNGKFNQIFFISLQPMNNTVKCPQCNSEFTYEDQNKMVCTQCFHEWIPAQESTSQVDESRVIDSNGNELQNGDTVILIKDLPVKGAPKPLKAGTKVKNIRLSDGDHNISCKIEGYGAMALKSEFVKKVI